MRHPLWTGAALFLAGITVGMLGGGQRHTDIAAGLLYAAGLAFATWGLTQRHVNWPRRSTSRAPLAPRLADGERWCVRCGRIAPQRRPCPTCHHIPVPRRRRRDPQKELKENP